jgi:uncharacterized protein (DUF169 family)
MNAEACRALAAELSNLLRPQVPPLAITFSQAPPAGVPAFEGDKPPLTPDGRTGRVPAGCVFWMKATERTFTTVPEDHGNCSVGSVTHGIKRLDEVANNGDVAALLASGWVTRDLVPHIPTVREHPSYITYGPLQDTTVDPDVVFLRLNAKQVMMLHDALPELRFEGKPQCHIIAIAKEQGEVAVSVGCMLSRVRTGMPNGEMTCAIPARRLTEVVERLRRACDADTSVAVYASEDAKRFPEWSTRPLD